MDTILKNEAVLADCKIYQMLRAHACAPHLSFHTPGHKVGAWDITELSYSDNLSCPRGCIMEAEKDIANILGASKSFLLTDGSTSGILSMLYAAKSLGARTVAFCEESHKSVFNGCALLGLTPLLYPAVKKDGIPYAPTMYALKKENKEVLAQADALLITSPDYYGNVADLAEIRKYCDENGKLLLIDGAHGGHLHFDKNLYAGAYADMWVDGAHKSLPALTQGAVVSARTEKEAAALEKAVDVFRTTSPSYPIMASVEYAVKYPRNEDLEEAVRAYVIESERVYPSKDWTKLCVKFGGFAFEAEKDLEKEGIFAEFCDGNVLTFYLSPATEMTDFQRLQSALARLFKKYPSYVCVETESAVFVTEGEKEWVDLSESVGRICAGICGLFPPCVPLFQVGERITEEKTERLKKAGNVFGLKNGKILVLKEEEI